MLFRRLAPTTVRHSAAAAAVLNGAVSSSFPSTATSSTSSTFQIAKRFQASQAAAPAKPKNPYKVLGLKPGADVKAIKKAHRIMTRKYHPDVPGGSHDKFQEIQDAYEQVKTGVWVKKGGEPDGKGGEAQKNRYANFRFTQGGKRRKQSYEETYTGMHTNKNKSGVHDDFDEEAGTNARKSPFGPDSVQFQAWTRLMTAWAVSFVVLRIVLFFTFPPKYEKVQKRKLSERPRKPPPPKPLAPSTPVLS